MANTKSGLVAAQIYTTSGNGEPDGKVLVDCHFNPDNYTISKSNSFEEKASNKKDTPQVNFKKAGAQTLKLQLIFDSHDTKDDLSKTAILLWKLMEVRTVNDSDEKKKGRPPECVFKWGSVHFKAFITSMSQKFTHFTHQGVPIRLTADVTFTQYDDKNDFKPQNPTSGGGPIEEVRQVMAGDRLDTIAFEVYGDATKWRVIAERNNIIDPLALRPGTQLTIPQI